MELERAILTLFAQGHASDRGIQACLKELLGVQVSLGKIVAVKQEAGQRAQAWMSRQKPVEEDCAIALDEQYGGKRGEGYLTIVDAHSSFVWASVPPVAVDGESWTLVLWYLPEQAVVWQTAATDGGQAMQDGLSAIKAASKQQRDVWHLSHLGSQVQGRVERTLKKLQEQLPSVQRQAQRIAEGKKARGANPRTDMQAHLALLKQVEYLACGLSSLRSEMRRLLDVVVLGETSTQGILDSPSRQSELETVVHLLVELEHEAPTDLADEIRSLHKQLRLALPNLLLFGRRAGSDPARGRWGAGRRGHLPDGLGRAQAGLNCFKASLRTGTSSSSHFSWLGIGLCEPAVWWKTGTAFCARIWPCIAASQRGCWHS